jgi:hypothetical protein
MEPSIVTLAGLTTGDVSTLSAADVTSSQDIMILNLDDLVLILPNATVLLRRKLSRIASYLANGHSVTGTTTMQTVMAGLSSGPAANQPPAAPPTPYIADPSARAPKLYVDGLAVYDGTPIKWEDWEVGTIATLGQTVYSSLLTTPPTAGDAVAEARNRELYNMIVKATYLGSALHIVKSCPIDDGHSVITALKNWYGSADTSRTMIEHYRQKMESLSLDEGTVATVYINDFIICCQKLEDKNEGDTAETKRHKFLEKIVDEDYDVVCQQLKGDDTKTFEQCVNRIRQREQELELSNGTPAKKAKARRNKFDKSPSSSGDIPSIPASILYKLEPENMRKALIKWRGVWNSEKRHITPEEFPPGNHETDRGSNKEREGGKNRDAKGSKQNKSKKPKYRRTTTSTSGIKDSSPIVSFKDRDDEQEENDTSSDDSESDTTQPDRRSANSKKKKSKKAPKRKRNRRNSVTQDGRIQGEMPRVIIDAGSEVELVCAAAWVPIARLNVNTQVMGAVEGMGGMQLPIVHAATAYEHPTIGTILLGIANTAFDERPEQTESLVNSHVLRYNNVVVHDITKRDGGLQCLEVENVNIELDFVDSATLSFETRKPTKKELDELEVIWLTRKIPDKQSHLLRPSQTRRNAATIQPEPVPWEGRLGNCPELLTVKTLDATTQLCSNPVEMDNREAPQQHRKQRVRPLHPKRVTGRTDSDTFFSTIKSVMGFSCVQLFFCHISQLLYVKCMRRESHSHGAYQDFVRNVGAPNVLLTDNAKTQIGKKWTGTSRVNVTKQINSAPHNQNQNQAERKIRDVKRRVMLTLRRSCAPLIFWCFCLYFIVDCLNHTASKQLEWRTPRERHDGHTPDISMFRFQFWEPVWYYEPTAKYPSPNFLPGRFIGIAWDHGDAFTYEIWTTPNNIWENGTKLIRNVVQSRQTEDADPRVEYDDNDLDFTKQDPTKKYKTKKNKKRKHREEQRNVPNDNETSGDEVVERTKSRVRFSPNTPQFLKPEEQGGGKDTSTSTTQQPNTKNPNEPTMATTRNPKRSREETDDEDEGITLNIDPFEASEPIEMTTEINDFLPHTPNVSEVGGARIVGIKGHSWFAGQLKLEVSWSTEEQSWETLADLKADHPKLTANYLIDNNVTRSKRSDRNLQWAKKTIRDLDRAVRRIARLYHTYLDEEDDVYTVRRVLRRNKKKKKFTPGPSFKYGVEVPQSVRQALEFDKANGNTAWQDSIEAEMSQLVRLKCFDFEAPDFEPAPDYQKTRLRLIFGVKQDLRRKSRLVAGGHLIDVLDHDVYSSTVKGISVKILHVIAHQQKLKQLCGDVTNAFVNAYTNEKVYAVAGLEFGEEAVGKIVIIRKALYGLASSAERWHSHFADTLRGLGFTPTRYDNDVWIRPSENKKGYEYICTHVDDFMIVAKRPDLIMQKLQEVYAIGEKSITEPEYYLGNDYKKDRKGRWCIGCKQYLKEALARVESIFGSLRKCSVPMTAGDHPELDDSPLLNDDKHRKYQMIIGMLNWVVTIGRLDVAFSTSSLSRFTACPREGHLDRSLHVFGYLKKRPNRRIVVDSRDPIFENCEDDFEIDYTVELESMYPDAFEEIDANLPEAMFDELAITAFVDSDHAHDKVTRRSVTGLLILVGRTPVFFSSKRQGSVETSTYGAEFCAMRTAAEEIIAVRYMIRCLGVKVRRATPVFGDNLGVIQNCTIKESLLKKKHVAIAYHKVRECAAAQIVHPIKISGVRNWADMLTKSLIERVFRYLTNGVMHG